MESSNQIHSIKLGFPVTYSTLYKAHDCKIWRLDVENNAWSPQENDLSQWVQVSSIKPELWIAVITQGRGNWDQWIEQFKVSYSNGGQLWEYVDQGKVFKANNDRNSKIRNNFNKGVIARSIRIHPMRWHKHISMRFQAIFISS